ncbi:MAG: GHKL domain-containing protein [Anaerolineaceae bacterium]|nr:GHKL domain-containing protein [Anaerolineaceae bacterium]
MTANQTAIQAIHLLTKLNNPQLSLADYEAEFLKGLIELLDADYSVLLRTDDQGGSRAKRKTALRQGGEVVEEDVLFERGILYEAYDQLKIMECSASEKGDVNVTVDVPAGVTLRNLIALPLMYQTRLFGILAVGNSSGFPFDRSNQDVILHLAGVLSAHIHSVELILNLEESNDSLLLSQEQLLNSRNTLRTLFDNIPESFYIVDEFFTLIAINQSRADRAGQPPQKLVGQKCYEQLFQLNAPCPGCLVQKTLQNNRADVRRMHYLQRDNSNLEWEIHTYPVPPVEGKLRQVILLEQNITEKRKLEAELIQSEKLAAVGQLAAGIAHDINNPLTSIIANSQMLIADIPEDMADLLHSARLIELAGTKATQVVKNLLSTARKEEFTFEPIDLNENIQSSLMLLSHEFISRNINICFDRGYEMPMIMASDNHLQSVWTNLIMNSIEAISGETGKVTISSQFDGSNFIVKVEDDGNGIPNECIGQIFEPFFTTKRSEEGTGLGLTSVRRIVQAHNGQIMVESEEGKGTTFMVVLPKEQKGS